MHLRRSLREDECHPVIECITRNTSGAQNKHGMLINNNIFETKSLYDSR